MPFAASRPSGCLPTAHQGQRALRADIAHTWILHEISRLAQRSRRIPLLASLAKRVISAPAVEESVAKPSTGSFADYSRDALGHWAGFSVGWLYWYFWEIVVGFEAIAGTLTSVLAFRVSPRKNRLVPNAKHASISGTPSTSIADAEYEDATDGADSRCSRSCRRLPEPEVP